MMSCCSFPSIFFDASRRCFETCFCLLQGINQLKEQKTDRQPTPDHQPTYLHRNRPAARATMPLDWGSSA